MHSAQATHISPTFGIFRIEHEKHRLTSRTTRVSQLSSNFTTGLLQGMEVQVRLAVGNEVVSALIDSSAPPLCLVVAVQDVVHRSLQGHKYAGTSAFLRGAVDVQIGKLGLNSSHIEFFHADEVVAEVKEGIATTKSLNTRRCRHLDLDWQNLGQKWFHVLNNLTADFSSRERRGVEVDVRLFSENCSDGSRAGRYADKSGPVNGIVIPRRHKVSQRNQHTSVLTHDGRAMNVQGLEIGLDVPEVHLLEADDVVVDNLNLNSPLPRRIVRKQITGEVCLQRSHLIPHRV
mmetsp:Transcript_17414/g.44418  ORF Transcript_17414/g.44418 Transcript_17414/m.44418 type:complete len:289 (-) Transcript_17414:659-1525(-)